MKSIGKLHDDIKQNYESGKYKNSFQKDAYYQRVDKRKYYLRGLCFNVAVLLILIAISMLSSIADNKLLSFIFEIFILLSFISSIYALVFLIKNRRNTQPK